MKYEVSKEVYEAVTGEDTGDIFEIYYKPRIDFDTFFFKCKEWAFDNGVYLSSWKDEDYCYCEALVGVKEIDFEADSEQQAVFDATDYTRKELLK